jgi:hypothetical protein
MEGEIRVGGLLNAIRQRPAMYLDERSVYGLWCFLAGYSLALSSSTQGSVSADLLPDDFHDWVAYRLGFYEATSGWRRMIEGRVPDQAAVLDCFFQLLDEYYKRKPRVVARVEGVEQKWTELGRDGAWRNESFRGSLSLVSYTDDPGFFIKPDDEQAHYPGKFAGRDQFCPTLKSLELYFGAIKEKLTILDRGTFEKWLSQEDRFDSPS